MTASTIKTIIRAAFTDAVERGEIHPDEEVAIADLEAYYLPGTDGAV